MTGMVTAFVMLPSALAASRSGTAILMISQPAFSRDFICLTVAFTSLVFVLVMDCTEIGLPPPTGTLPTYIFFVFLRVAMFFCCGILHLLLPLPVEFYSLYMLLGSG